MNDEKIKAASAFNLLQWMQNALSTTSCIGHTKGFSNETLAAKYREELISRGCDIPSIDFWVNLKTPGERGASYRSEMAEAGTFNGPGSV